jgi:hypothetical protein
MKFLFVDNNTVQDEKARKLIRSHCMRGKNTVKTRLKAQKGSPATSRGNEDVRLAKMHRKGIEQAMVVSMYSTIGHRFSSVSLAAPIDQRMSDLLSRCKRAITENKEIAAHEIDSFRVH